MNHTNVELAHFKFLPSWVPQIGDMVVYHGFIYGRWFGVVSAISPSDHTVTIIKNGLPVLLVTLDPGEYEKNQEVLSMATIRNSTGGKYAVLRAVNNNLLWFV